MTNNDIEKISHSKAYKLWYKKLVKETGSGIWDLPTLRICKPNLYKSLEFIVNGLKGYNRKEECEK